MEAATHSEKEPRRSLWRALIYTGVHGLGLAWLFFCAVYVAPQFEAMFREWGAELPPPTQFVITASSFARTYFFALAPFAGFLLFLDFTLLARLLGRRRNGIAKWWTIAIFLLEGFAFLGIYVALCFPLDGGIHTMPR